MPERSEDSATSQATLLSAGQVGAGGLRLGILPPAIRLMRPHQWIKNAFVAAPLFFTPQALSMHAFGLVLAGILAFCLVSSAVYVLNDYVDRKADRLHPMKRRRPIASGEVSAPAALVLLAALLVGGLSLAFDLDTSFGALAAAYFVVNLAYSFGLKHKSILDIMSIALGFVLRVFGGAVLIAVEPSVWLILSTGLVAMFLALAKRRDDLVRSLDGNHRQSLAGYSKPFLDTAVSIMLAALLVTYMIYTTDDAVMAQLASDKLYLTVPFVMAGVLRYLQIMLVEERSGSPTTLVLTDRFLIGCMGLWLVTFAVLVYA